MIQQTPRGSGKPHFCTPCGGYRPRSHECDRPRTPAPVADPAPFDLAEVPRVSSPDYLAGWRAGYAAAAADRAERAAR